MVLNASNLHVLGVMNVCTLIGLLLTLCQSCLPIKGIFWVLILVSLISTCIHAYTTKVATNFLAWKNHFNFRYLEAFCICILMGIAGSCGVGLPFVLALTCWRQNTLKLLVLKYAFSIPHICLPLDNKPIEQTSIVHDDPGICATPTTIKRPRSVGKENVCQGDSIPPPKRGCKSKSVDDNTDVATNW